MYYIIFSIIPLASTLKRLIKVVNDKNTLIRSALNVRFIALMLDAGSIDYNTDS